MKPAISADLAGARCLVLGGRGFIGSHLIDSLLSLGAKVRCFDRPHVSQLGHSHQNNSNFELFEGDFSSESDIAAALEGCKYVYHMISTTLPKSSNADMAFDVETNLIGTVRLLTHAARLDVAKVVFVSSGGTVYGVPRTVPIVETHPTDPVCSYGITKLAIEKYLRLFHELHGLDYTVLRLSNPYGERQRVHASQGAVAVFLGKVLRGEPIEIWGDGSIVRDYIYISDVVDALVLARQPTSDRLFNIGAGQGLSLNEMLAHIEKVTGRPATRRYLPGRPFDVPASVLCVSRAREGLGWEPNISFEAGLRLFSDWLQQHPDAD